MPFLLPAIQEPSDLQSLSLQELNQLSQEMRDCIIETVSMQGGHLAPSLGVVELTIALHSIFQSPRDQIIWDVGHQCYAHKLLTGRYESFVSLRSDGGLSGFPRREESHHDILNTGHSSTSISAALGLALGRDLKGESQRHVIAVIGDGALGAGMAFEALNHTGTMKSRLIIVLNDNEMSIAPNVGALSRYLSLIRTEPFLGRMRDDLEFLLRRIPAIGYQMAQTTERVKNSLKQLLVPGMLFEQLGITYLGPVDGHHLGDIREYLGHARKMRGPVLVHILTKKGKGYPPAEKEPCRFHGTPPFHIRTGAVKEKKSTPSYTSLFSSYLLQLAQEDDRLLAITAAMPDGTGLTPFAQRYPDRFFDVGIAEQHATTLAAGLARQGFRPVLCLYSTFLQRAYDQVIHDLALQRLPVIIALDRAGLVGDDGETHQGLFDLSFLRPVPQLVIMAPGDEEELGHMLKTALNYEEGPVVIRYPRGPGPGSKQAQELKTLPLGKGRLLLQGEEVCIIAVGSALWPSLEASRLLLQEGLKVSVVDARFIKPLDEECIKEMAREHEILITVEENTRTGGFGSAVLELLNDAQLLQDLTVKRLGLPDRFIEHGAQSLLRRRYGLVPTAIRDQVKDLLPKSNLSLSSLRRA